VGRAGIEPARTGWKSRSSNDIESELRPYAEKLAGGDVDRRGALPTPCQNPYGRVARMRSRLPERLLTLGLLVASSGCGESGKPYALPVSDDFSDCSTGWSTDTDASQPSTEQSTIYVSSSTGERRAR
jgi:hypothetical protein